MKITKTTFSYDFDFLMKELSTLSNNEASLNQLISFLTENILYGVFSSEDVFEDNPYDWSITKEFVLEIHETIFREDTLTYIEDICVSVDYSSYDSYVQNPSNLKLKENVEVQLFPIFPLFDMYCEKVEDLFNFKDPWDFLDIIEKFSKKYEEEYLKHSTYQFGGNMCFPTQREYEKFLGSFYGEYGDAGSVYVFVYNGEVLSSVDMF